MIASNNFLCYYRIFSKLMKCALAQHPQHLVGLYIPETSRNPPHNLYYYTGLFDKSHTLISTNSTLYRVNYEISLHAHYVFCFILV